MIQLYLHLPLSNWYISTGSEVSVEEFLHLFSTGINEERCLDFLDLFLCIGIETYKENPLKDKYKTSQYYLKVACTFILRYWTFIF